MRQKNAQESKATFFFFTQIRFALASPPGLDKNIYYTSSAPLLPRAMALDADLLECHSSSKVMKSFRKQELALPVRKQRIFEWSLR